MNKITRIVLITPDLSAGGAERVIATLANSFAENNKLEIHIIFLIQGQMFYKMHPNICLHYPHFNYKNFVRPLAVLKSFHFLRKKIKEINPVSYLCFGGKYNAMAILAGWGLKTKCFISDRSRPGISYGQVLDKLNKIIYPYAFGIIAQTSKAKDFHLRTFKHENICVIGNPVPDLHNPLIEKENIILNVGRFIPSKRQLLLLDIFYKLNLENWQLWFLGDGEQIEKCIQTAEAYGISHKVLFLSSQKDVAHYYNKCKIFAFTSDSEGFPNALAEAMSAGCACISFDCIAGPSDLIENEIDGYLIPMDDQNAFQLNLQSLILNKELRIKYGNQAKEKVKLWEERLISSAYLNFLLEKN